MNSSKVCDARWRWFIGWYDRTNFLRWPKMSWDHEYQLTRPKNFCPKEATIRLCVTNVMCDECPDKNIKNSLRQHRLLSKWLIPCVGKKDALRIFYDEIGSIRNVPGIFKYDALDPRVERSRTFFKIRRLPMKIYECGIPDNKKTSKGSTSRLGMAKYLS